MIDIYTIALDFERIFPDNVDKTKADNGEQEAGYVGHDDDGGTVSIGWFCGGCTVGHP